MCPSLLHPFSCQGPVRPLETVSTKQGAHVQEVSTSPFCPGNLAWRMFSALQASFLDDPEKGKKLRELESHFSAAHWFGDPRAGSELMQLAVPFVVLHVLMVGKDAMWVKKQW